MANPNKTVGKWLQKNPRPQAPRSEAWQKQFADFSAFCDHLTAEKLAGRMTHEEAVRQMEDFMRNGYTHPTEGGTA